MKKTTIIIALLLSQVVICAQTDDSCLPQGITFTTQEQINNFQINHPNCTEIEGDVEIIGNDITNMNGLNVLTFIGGDFGIVATEALTSLVGLENLTAIGGDFIMGSVSFITNLNGLNNLQSIGGTIHFGYHTMGGITGTSLTSLLGIESLTNVGGDVRLLCNPMLEDLSGLSGLANIGGNLLIGESSLHSLNGLGNLVSIGGDFAAGSDPFPLTSLEGVDNLASIGGSIIIGSSLALTSLSGLENITTIGGNLDINGNQALISLTGLENLSTIGGYILIESNFALNSLAGLENIAAESITGLYILDNGLLSSCEVQSICEYLASPNAIVDIDYNAPGCNSPEEVEEACLYISISEEEAEAQIQVYPNPVNDFATLSFEGNEPGGAIVNLYNSTGICIRTWQFTITSPGQCNFVMDFSGLPAGMYFCQVQFGNELLTKKILKKGTTAN